MATAGIYNGTNFRLFVGGLSVGYATSATLDITTETREAIHKDGAGTGFVDITLGQISGSCSVEGFLNEDANSVYSNNASKTLIDLHINKTKVGCVFKGGASGDMKFTFQAYIVGSSITTPAEDDGTVSFSLVTTGAITSTTVT